ERSKVAAEEIVGLAEGSYKLADEAGNKMMEVMPKVENSSKLVQEINAASLEQNSGSNQINSAVQQLNTITQQTAAASEELATSAEELSSQAESLKDAVAFFKIDQNDIWTTAAPVINQKPGNPGNSVKSKKKFSENKQEKGANILLEYNDEDEYEKF
ncbi:MAG: hypothetical protein ACOC31_02100, partial [Bacteroidota bacterium]